MAIFTWLPDHPVCAELIIGCCMTQQDIAAFPPVCPGYEAANYLVG